MVGCRCPQCYSLAEWCADKLGTTHGLHPAPGHPSPALPQAKPGSSSMTELSPGEFSRLQDLVAKRRAAKGFFWEEDAA